LLPLGPRVEQLTIGAPPSAWAEAGFSVKGEHCSVGAVGLRLASGEGVVDWKLSGVTQPEVDGLPTGAQASSDPVEPARHPNGVTHIDHLVVFTPDLERTTKAFEGLGVDRRRVREVETDEGTLRQGFFRLGEVILEVVEHARVEPGPARFWGITFAVEDLEACAKLLGDRLGTIRDAVQPGRRIATVSREAGLGLPVAMISPTP
jgi:hypothetical protein